MVSTEEQKCYHFRKGLRYSIRVVGTIQTKDYADLVESVRGVEQKQEITQKEKKCWQKNRIIFT
ncbi:hypothetical protein AXF42_Ash018884 [Apostasia shenzhenica]|uniref:Uncharacterized protein n=1 Tax=Apostasia shenzhenica TaxID=1088818 RepID=A0A2I0B514_9ASPA|nr:hypothetical protein AXF42_Ash018884 [Apostasia shenzhenica]